MDTKVSIKRAKQNGGNWIDEVNDVKTKEKYDWQRNKRY